MSAVQPPSDPIGVHRREFSELRRGALGLGGEPPYGPVAMSTHADDPAPTLTEAPLRVARHRPRPNGRAVVGGLLVCTAAIGVVAVTTADDGERGEPVVVLREAVDTGDVVAPGDVVVERATLPASVRDQVFGAPDEVVGRVAIAPLAAGDVARRSALDDVDAPAADAERRRRELSFAVERDHAMNGELRRGETVDVVATYGTGESAVTSVVAADAIVRSVDEGGADTLGSSGSLVVTLALVDRAEVLAVAHAADAAVVRLVQATGTGSPDADRVADVYRGPVPVPGPGAVGGGR
jgi:hypothetical protein